MKEKVLTSLTVLILTLVMMICTESKIEAAEVSKQSDYVLIDNSVKVPLYQNYTNPKTGEYFRWNISTDSRGSVAKRFSFKIRYSVESSKFTINSSKVKVKVSADIEDYTGTPSEFNNKGHRYEIEIFNFLTISKTLHCAIGGTESGTLSGFNPGSKYKVRITNNDALSDANYLVGEGTIKND